MFLDYYAILDIPFGSTDAEIKRGYKKQALKWHPDRNSDPQAKDKIQLINEAYLILSDSEAKKVYDAEYLNYKETSYTENEKNDPFVSKSYEIASEVLKKWISNARKQASDLTKESIQDIIGISKEVGKQVGKEIPYIILRALILVIIMGFLARACHK